MKMKRGIILWKSPQIGYGIIALLFLHSCDAKREPFSLTDTGMGDTSITYVRAIAPMISARCGACHVSDAQGGVSFASYAEVRSLIDRIIIRAGNGSMPPAGYLLLTAAQIDTLKKWRANGKIQGTGSVSPDVPVDSTITYSLHIGRLIANHCGDCHIGDDISGGVSLAAYSSVASVIDRIIGRIEAGTMPPPTGDYPPLTKSQVDTFKIWRVSGKKQ
jgi:mono/diheme cytochrome c family protein